MMVYGPGLSDRSGGQASGAYEYRNRRGPRFPRAQKAIETEYGRERGIRFCRNGAVKFQLEKLRTARTNREKSIFLIFARGGVREIFLSVIPTIVTDGFAIG